MKKALVLCGGGSRGAYEIGVYKAIKELKLEFDIITGTSIGSLIGCLFAQHDYEVACDLWASMSIESVMKDGISFNFSIDSILKQKDKIGPFLKQYLNHKGADNTPLIEMVHRLANEEKLRASNIDFGCVCVKYPSLEPVLITKDEIPEGKLADYLIASSSCFPAFPLHEIEGEKYMDGGYFDNLPIQLALKMGAFEILAIDLNYGKPVHPCYQNSPNIKYILPSIDLGSFLSFEEEQLHNNTLLGYNDMMKAYHQLLGFEYTFENNIKEEIQNQIVSTFIHLVNHFELQMFDGKKQSTLSFFSNHPLTDMISDNIKLKNHMIHYQTYLLLGCEITGELLEVNKYPIYDFEAFNRKLLTIVKELDCQDYMEFVDELISKKDLKVMKELVSNLNHQRFTVCLYHRLNNVDRAGQMQEMRLLAMFLPKELIGALYLCSIDQIFQ